MPPKVQAKPKAQNTQKETANMGVNMAGRDITFYKRDFTPEESNFFLYRTEFLYVCFGIPGIEGMLGVNIRELLLLNGTLNDDQVKKMIWVVCNFNHYLSNPNLYSNKETFISLLVSEYSNEDRHNAQNPEEIAKSIATLVVRVFVAFQMRINLGNDASAVGAAQQQPPTEVGAAQQQPPTEVAQVVTAELNTDITTLHSNLESPEQRTLILESNTTKMEEINTAVSEKIEKINEGSAESVAQSSSHPESTRRISDRVRLLNEALGREAEKRKEKQAAAAAEAEDAKREKIRIETERLQQCIDSFGESIKFIEPIPAGIHKEFPSIKFDPTKFYKLLPKVLARMISSINRRIVTTEIKPGPGTAETLNSLGLPDPGIKIQADDEEQGGGSSSRSRRFCITKRKKNNKILRRFNSKNKKNPRNILYGGAPVRHFVEHAQPIPQCEGTIGNYHKYVNPTCYICGEPWINGKQSSMECEHILCVIHGIEYYGLLQSVYLSEEQKNFLSILYAWAHRCCNQRKRNIAFIRKNPNQDASARGNYFVPDDVNIRELLSDIYTLSTYPDSNPKHKFDCNKILIKVKDNKKQFVDKRTAVVTSYVTPLVACINTVFTGLFLANMVLFNAIGCLKIIAEMSIYLTAVRKNDTRLQLEFTKTASFMSEIVFPDCVQASAGEGGGCGRRIIQDNKTRKSSRRKIQRGGAVEDIISAIDGLLAQEEYEIQMNDFKKAIDVYVEVGVDGNPNPSSSRSLSNTLNTMFPGSPSPSEEPPNPLPQLEAGLTETDPTKMDAILFILFVLNHSRNPTILLDLFLDLKVPRPSIVREEEEEEEEEEAEEEAEPVSSVGDDINASSDAYGRKRQGNKEAFINICERVFANRDTMTNINQFFTHCDMLPSFLGVVTFCARHGIHSSEFQVMLSYIRDSLFGDVHNSLPVVNTFATKVTDFNKHLQTDSMLFASEVADPNTPLDHLVNACFHLKQYGGHDTRGVLLEACCLFPSCFGHEDIFSQFGPCHAYGDGVLENPHFQKALGCVAAAKTTCARILIEELQVTPSKHSSVDKMVALQLFNQFFDHKDNEILSKLYQPVHSMTPTHVSFGNGSVKTEQPELQSQIHQAIQNFGNNSTNDLLNFVHIIHGMMLSNEVNPRSTDDIRQYIRYNLSTNKDNFAIDIASFLVENGNKYKRDTLLFMLVKDLFPTVWESVGLGQAVKTQRQPDTPDTARKGKLRQGESPPPPGPSHGNANTWLQSEIVGRFHNFITLLVSEHNHIDDSPGALMDSQDITQIERIWRLMTEFKINFDGVSPNMILTRHFMINYLTSVINLLLSSQSVPLSPSSDLSQSPEPQTDSRSTAQKILETYNYFQDESFEDVDIKVVYGYIMNPGGLRGNLKDKINYGRPRGMTKLRGGSSLHNTKRQHRKKQKIKSRRRKNKYNKTKTRKNRNS